MSEITTAEQRRIIQRARFGTFLTNEYVKAASQDLSRALPRIISDYDIAQLTKREITKMTAELRVKFNDIWGAMWDSINKDLDVYAYDEAEFARKLYSQFSSAAMTIPTSAIIVSAAENAILTLTSGDVTRAGTWTQFIKQNQNSTFGLIDGVIKLGYQEGQTNSEIVSLLRGRYNRKTKLYEGGVINVKSVQRAEALVRTGASHYSAVARDKFMQANRDVIDSRILYATFDSRTSIICQTRHLQEWDIDDNTYPRLPFHFNERSVYLIRVDGIDPFTGKRASKGAEGGQQVEADLTMSEWLKTQPQSFIDETLGKTRGKLFSEGGLPINKFTDLQGRTLTLDELRQTTAGRKAFEAIE